MAVGWTSPLWERLRSIGMATSTSSQFGRVLAGMGGFINISQNAKRVVFCGTMTSRGLDVAVENGQLRIAQEGTTRKFVNDVNQVSFSGDLARSGERDVLYVTERAVFRLTPEGVELTEVAPGIDVDSQVLGVMDFDPIVKDVQPMHAGLFAG